MTESDAALLRGQLHWRGGKRRLRQGKDAAGIAALYDALIHALRWYVLLPAHRERIGNVEPAALKDERDDFLLLVRAGILQNISDFDMLYSVVGKSLDDPTWKFDAQAEATKIEQWMSQLGVTPFDEAALPPENPAAL